MFYFSIYWECHHPNWRTHIFQRAWNHQPVMDFLWSSYDFRIQNSVAFGFPSDHDTGASVDVNDLKAEGDFFSDQCLFSDNFRVFSPLKLGYNGIPRIFLALGKPKTLRWVIHWCFTKSRAVGLSCLSTGDINMFSPTWENHGFIVKSIWAMGFCRFLVSNWPWGFVTIKQSQWNNPWLL